MEPGKTKRSRTCEPGLLRGASLEFMPEKERLLETDKDKGPLYEIMKGKGDQAVAR